MRLKTIKAIWLAAGILLAAFLGSKILTALGTQNGKTPLLAGSPETAQAIDRISLEAGSQRLELSRKEGKWMLTAPEEFPANQASVEEIASAFVKAQVEDKVSSRADRLSDFELDDARAIKISAKDVSGKTLVSGKLGKSVTGRFDRSYFSFEGSSGIYIVRLPRYQLERTASDLKDQLILEAPRDQIASLEIRRGKERLEIMASEAGWKVNGKPAMQDKVGEILDIFTRLETNDFASAGETKQGLKKLGLDKKPKELSVSLRLKDGQAYVLSVGEKKDTLYFAKLDDRPVIWRLAEWKVSPLRISVKDLTKTADVKPRRVAPARK